MSIPAGALTGTIPATILEDAIDEDDETYQVRLSNPANAAIADGVGLGLITDNDTAGVEVSPTSLSVAEPDGTAPFTLRLSSRPAAAVTIDLASLDPGQCTVTPVT